MVRRPDDRDSLTGAAPEHRDASPPRCETPVALLLFNRPSTTGRVFEAIRAVRPRQLFLIADGPRATHPEDLQQCAAARAIAEVIDWDCALRTNYASDNLGIKARVDSGLSWLFTQVEEAIVLEDDCLPDPSFFRFCQEMLEQYRDQPRVMTISGSDFTFGRHDRRASYSFSRYPLIWGWATWRRAWRHYDAAMRAWPAARDTGWLERYLDDPRAVQYWGFTLQQNAETLENWDYAWLWSVWERDGLAVHPNVNLVTNIGFGAGATHTHDAVNLFAGVPSEPITFPLRHPVLLERDSERDRLVESTAFSGTLDLLWQRLWARRRARAQPS